MVGNASYLAIMDILDPGPNIFCVNIDLVHPAILKEHNKSIRTVTLRSVRR